MICNLYRFIKKSLTSSIRECKYKHQWFIVDVFVSITANARYSTCLLSSQQLLTRQRQKSIVQCYSYQCPTCLYESSGTAWVSNRFPLSCDVFAHKDRNHDLTALIISSAVGRNPILSLLTDLLFVKMSLLSISVV